MFRGKRTLLIGLALVLGVGLGLPATWNALVKPDRAATVMRGPPLSRAVESKARHGISPEALRAASDEEPADRADEVPYVGPVHEAVADDGTVVSYQEVAPGYVQTRLDAVDLEQYEPEEEASPVPSLPAGRTPVDPRTFGFASLEELEADARQRLKIPSDRRVELWSEERHGKKGLAIVTMAPGPRGTELPDEGRAR
jgi:hypothetical protein